MAKDALVPLGAATASDVRDLKRPGLMLPVGNHDETLLLTNWDGEMHGVMLTGEHAFIFWPINVKSPHFGLFLPEPEILVDVASATSGVGCEHDEGVLILGRDALSVVASRAGDQFSNPLLVPLWKKVEAGSEGAKIAFTRWGIGLPEGDGFRTLWEWRKPAKSTVEFYENA